MYAHQPALFPNLVAEFPSTRYQGSKVKLVDWIWSQLADFDFSTCLDAFGGTGAVIYFSYEEILFQNLLYMDEYN